MFSFTRTNAGAISMTFEIEGMLPGEIAKQIPFAAALALNRTGDEAARIGRRRAAKKFIRRGAQSDQFFDASFTLVKFATKRDLSISFGISDRLRQNASTSVNQGGGLGRRAVSLIAFEDGTDRVQPSGRTNANLLYAPVTGSSLKPDVRDLLPKWAYPKALGLIDAPLNGGGRQFGQDRTPDRRGSKRGLRARENRMAFILRRDDGSPIGIFRRVQGLGPQLKGTRRGSKLYGGRVRPGAGGTVLELLFATPKRIKIDNRLQFLPNAERDMAARINVNFQGMFALILNPARMQRQRDLADVDRALFRRS